MAVNELIDRRQFTKNNVSGYTETRYYIVDGAADENAAIAQVEASAESPATINLDGTTLERREISATEFYVSGGNQFRATVKYVESSRQERGGRRQPTVGESEFGFNIAMPNTTFRAALPEINPGAAPKVAGFEQWIYEGEGNAGDGRFPLGVVGVAADGTVEGRQYDPIGPGFQHTKILSEATVVPTYIEAAADLVGKIAPANTLNFAASNLLLTGMHGRQRNNSEWTVTFDFNVGIGKNGITVAGVNNIDTQPFDVIEVRFMPNFDAVGGVVVSSVVHSVVVSSVFEQASAAQWAILEV